MSTRPKIDPAQLSPAPQIALPDSDRAHVCVILNALLADEHVLYTKTRNFHWNVVGPDFHAVHKFLEELYTDLEEEIDEIAERTRALGGVAAGTLTEFLKLSRLAETPGELPNQSGMIAALLADHETIIRQLRGDIDQVGGKYHDVGTNDFLTGVLEKHEKQAWMLRSHLA